MKCRKCESENPAGIKFCGECGTELTLAFPSCYASNPPQFKFCGECGHTLSPSDIATEFRAGCGADGWVPRAEGELAKLS